MHQKKSPASGAGLFLKIVVDPLLVVALCHEAVAAQYGLATFFHWTWLEGDLALSSALGADSIVHFALTHALGLSSGAAFFAALRCTKIFGVVELLFAFCEDECGAAIAACDLLISHKKDKKENNWTDTFLVSRDRYFRTKDAVR